MRSDKEKNLVTENKYTKMEKNILKIENVIIYLLNAF